MSPTRWFQINPSFHEHANRSGAHACFTPGNVLASARRGGASQSRRGIDVTAPDPCIPHVCILRTGPPSHACLAANSCSRNANAQPSIISIRPDLDNLQYWCMQMPSSWRLSISLHQLPVSQAHFSASPEWLRSMHVSKTPSGQRSVGQGPASCERLFLISMRTPVPVMLHCRASSSRELLFPCASSLLLLCNAILPSYSNRQYSSFAIHNGLRGHLLSLPRNVGFRSGLAASRR